MAEILCQSHFRLLKMINSSDYGFGAHKNEKINKNMVTPFWTSVALQRAVTVACETFRGKVLDLDTELTTRTDLTIALTKVSIDIAVFWQKFKKTEADMRKRG